jgi:flagellar basal body-associated protein FliL
MKKKSEKKIKKSFINKKIVFIIILMIIILFVVFSIFFIFKRYSGKGNKSGDSIAQSLASITKDVGKIKCNDSNNWCDKKDSTKDGLVNIKDLVIIAKKVS